MAERNTSKRKWTAEEVQQWYRDTGAFTYANPDDLNIIVKKPRREGLTVNWATRTIAEKALEDAHNANPGPWANHSRYVALACKNIAELCPHLDTDDAYIYGILHDIGRHAGVTSERHLIDGYRYCMARGWEKAAQICISHAFMVKDISSSIGIFDMPQEDKNFMERFVKDAVYDDYDRLVQLCDALALPTGFCLLEKRFVDVAIRYGTHPATVDRWKTVLNIKTHFEAIIGCSI